MEKESVKKQRKYGIPLIAVLCLLFLIAAIVLYFVTGEEYVSYYYEDDSELALVSASPMDAGGVSQDSAIILEWNRPVSIDVADEVTLTPSARGKWSVSGNQLIFTPQQLAAGTYYTVSLPKGIRLNQRGDVLENDVFFSFETENPDIRVPDDTAFSVAGRGFCFSNEETVSIPVSLLDAKDRTVDVSVYRADNSDSFVKAFAELFAYPSWAELSIGNFQVEEWNFDEISSSEMAIRTGESTSSVNLGSLPEGQYLIRLAAAGSSYDVAVTVSPFRLGMICDHGVLSLWAMYAETTSGEPVVKGKAEVNGKAVSLDENGFASVEYSFHREEIHNNPSALAVTVTDEAEEIVSFLSIDDVVPVYDGDLFLDHPKLKAGDSLQASGTVFSRLGVPAEGTATLLFCSSVGVLETVDVDLENGYFSHQWENLSLADGEYRVLLLYDGMSLEVDTVSVGEESYELNLSVTPSNDSITDGESVTYRAFVSDQTGEPVTDAVVSLNGAEGVSVDRNGEALFRKTYRVAEGLASIRKNAVFLVDSPYGDAAEVTVSTSVHSASPVRVSTDEKSESLFDGFKLPLVLKDGVFVPAGEEETAAFHMTYDKTANSFDLKASAESTVFDVPDTVSAFSGETIAFTAESDRSSRRITLVSLYKGKIPDALCGKNLYNENLHDRIYGTLEENRVFFGNETVKAAFSSENRKGDYFIRLASKDLNGDVVSRYIPVKVYGFSLVCPDTSSYASGNIITLPFFVDCDEDLDYRLTVGEEEYRGTAKGKFSVSLGVSSVGQYSGKMEILKDDAIVASKEFSFAVYQKLPMFYSVQEAPSDHGVLFCHVKKDCADKFLTMFDIMALPGDQILQRMGKTRFYQTLGQRIPGDFSDMNFDLTALQNSDGGFGRFESAESDLLLSVLVAEQKDFLCDRASLCAYLKYRLTTADNPETAALACWGLSCFDYDCVESMSMIVDNGAHDDRTMLYLAEGYEAAGDKNEAFRLYDVLKKELKKDGDRLHMPESEDQYNIANTAFMLDLAQKLEQPEAEGLVDFLMNAKIENQTGRYLLLSCLLGIIDPEEIVLVNEDEAIESDETLLSFVPKDVSDAAPLTVSFSQNGKEVTSMRRSQVAEMTVSWEKTNNSIYLVYVKETKGVSVVEKDGLTAKGGYYEWVTDGDTATVSFCAEMAGEKIAPEIYVINLTTGEMIGSAEVNDWKVKK